MELRHRIVLNDTAENLQTIRRLKLGYTSDVGTIVLNLSTNQVKCLENAQVDILINTIDKVFTAQELQNAKWLVVRPSWQQFSISNFQSAFRCPCSKCDANYEQVDDVRVSQISKKPKRSFLKLPWLDEPIVTQELKLLLTNSKLKGFTFRPIYVGSSLFPSEMFSQLIISKVLPEHMQDSEMLYKQRQICSECGTVHGVVDRTMPMIFKHQLIGEEDIYKTFEYFGDRVVNRKIVISQAFYQYICNHELKNSLCVDDILLNSPGK